MVNLENSDTIKERVAVLEALLENQDKRHQKMEKKVDDMYDVIMQLRGAKWFGWFVAVGVGFLISNVTQIVNFLQGK